jgi:hypothetical protein
MPSNYTGDPDDIDVSTPTTIACPVDADPANAASVNTPLQKLADLIAFVRLVISGKSVVVEDDRDMTGGPRGDDPDLYPTHETRIAILRRKLLWEIAGGAAKIRLYIQPTGWLEITYNAEWLGPQFVGADTWVRDNDGTNSMRFRIGAVGNIEMHFSNQEYWVESAWSLPALLLSGRNPGYGEALVNTLSALAVPKAWGTIFFTGSEPQRLGGMNIAAPECPTNSLLRVNFAAPMANDHYAVTFGIDSTVANDICVPTVVARNAAYFEVDVRNKAGAAVALIGSTLKIGFSVFALQNGDEV